ncbi:hypothetical protein SAMN02787100_0040 [Chryseobacterium sp. OV279]|nr:hypothetical protein SAMN02787100_0040 [Chryseobacterium sp. OV279]
MKVGVKIFSDIRFQTSDFRYKIGDVRLFLGILAASTFGTMGFVVQSSNHQPTALGSFF